MNEQTITEQALGAALAEDELNLVVGGSGDPIESDPEKTGAN